MDRQEQELKKKIDELEKHIETIFRHIEKNPDSLKLDKTFFAAANKLVSLMDQYTELYGE